MWGRRVFARSPKPPDNQELLTLLRHGQRVPNSDRAPLFRVLMASTLIVPLTEPARAWAPGASKESAIIVLEREGIRALPGFTDLDTLTRFQPGGVPWIPMPAVELCRVAVQRQCDRVVVDPAGSVGYEMTRLEFQSLAEGLLPTGHRRAVVTTETSVQIGMPADRPPVSVLSALRAAVSLPEVQEVFWFWMAVAGIQPHLGLAVAPPSDQNCDRVGRAVEPIWQKHRPSNPVITVIGLDAGDLSQTVRQRGKLLYRAARE